MNRSTVAIIAVATLLLGSGVGGLLFVKPQLEAQGKLKNQKSLLEGQKTSLQSQVAELESRLKTMAMGAISYFDLRWVPDQRREMETKTVEALSSLTEIFNDNDIDVQALVPKGEVTGSNKPMPSPAASASPSASPTPAPGASPVEKPIQLTHKSFSFSVRGEYPNLVKALSEIQGLPKAISINQYDVRLVQDGKDAATPPKPGAPVISNSLLELDFHLSITYLVSGGMPPAAPGAATPVPSAVPVSVELFRWAAGWLGEPAYAAEATYTAAPAMKAPVRTRFELTGVAGSAGDLVVSTRRGVPRYRFSGTSTRLQLELAETRIAKAGSLGARVPGVRAVSARASTSDPGAAVIVVETDGTRFVPACHGSQLKLRRVAPFLVSKGAEKPRVLPPVAMSAASPPKRGATQRSAAPPAFQAQSQAMALPEAPHPKGQKAVKAEQATGRHVAIAPREDHTRAETWSALAERAAAEWASTQGGDPNSFTPPLGEPVDMPTRAPAMPSPASRAPEQPAVRPVAKSTVSPPARPAAMPAADALDRTIARPVATPLEQPAVDRGERAASQAGGRPTVRAFPRSVAIPAPKPAKGAATRMRDVVFEGGALVVRTEGPAPAFKVVGGDRASIVIELDQTRFPGSGRLFAVGQAGVKQVRAALYDNHPPRVRLVVDTDGSVAVRPVMGPDGVLRLRLAARPGTSSHEVRLASAASSAIVTATKENPITRDPASVRSSEPLRMASRKPKPRLLFEHQPVVRRIVTGSAARAAVQRAQSRRAKPRLPVLGSTRPVPTARPTPSSMATPMAVAKPSPAAVLVSTPMPTPAATPMGPSLARSLATTYSFPIDREKLSGRQNPFKPLARPKSKLEGKGAVPPPVPGNPSPMSPALPAMPLPGAGGTAGIPVLPKAPAAAATGYVLGGVLVGGGGPPMALVNVDGQSFTVGLNETLPGNARVTAIKVDHVILSAGGRSIRLDLKR